MKRFVLSSAAMRFIKMEMTVVAGSAARLRPEPSRVGSREVIFPECGCQQRGIKLNASLHRATFFSCEDSHSSVLCAILAKLPSHPNYLALFIIQRLCWRQALGFPKENCFYSYKWKMAGRSQCNPFGFCAEGKFNLPLPTSSICISALFIFLFLFLFADFISLPSAGTVRWETQTLRKQILPREDKKKRKKNPHKSGTAVIICCCGPRGEPITNEWRPQWPEVTKCHFSRPPSLSQSLHTTSLYIFPSLSTLYFPPS